MKDVNELAEKHWKYIRALLEIQEEKPSIIKKIGFHYKTAMVHGYGHGYEHGYEKEE